MSGNVWEWCSDWNGPYGSYEQTNPVGPATGSYRVNRGGCWESSFYDLCRVSSRNDPYYGGNNYFNPQGRNDFLGFRIVLLP